MPNGWLQHFKNRRYITWHSVSRGASEDLDLVQMWQENVKPIATQYAEEGYFLSGWNSTFSNVQTSENSNMKGIEVPGRERI